MPAIHCTIIKLRGDSLSPGLLAQVDAIFFEASGRTFLPGPEREAFRERWLGRYLQGGTDVVAGRGSATTHGRWLSRGCTGGPLQQPRFADIAYFRSGFAICAGAFRRTCTSISRPRYRSQGVGAQLIAAFAARAAKAGAPGMHVVTGKAMRNVRFYTRCGFAELGEAIWNGSELVFLAASQLA